jgi:beta-lactamase class A
MAGDLQSVLLEDNLSRPSRNQLTMWMEASLTGLERLRAELHGDWRAADKTGANGKDTSNDIAVLWPPGKPPVIVAAYITQCTGAESKRTAILAEIGRLVRESFT